MTKTGKALYDEKMGRVNDAIQLKVPDRVPFFPTAHMFAAKYVGMSFAEAFEDAERWYAANVKLAIDMDADISFSPDFAVFSSAGAFDAVKFKQLLIPGLQLDPNHSFQFVEGEYVKPEEYDAFLDDPTGFALRVYMPRIYGTLEAFSMLPPLTTFMMGYAGIPAIGAFAAPPIWAGFESLHAAAIESAKWSAAGAAFQQEMTERGYPLWAGGVALAPFDIISDFMRGMRGTMIDMYRRPDKLLAALDKVFPWSIGGAIAQCQMSGNPRVFIPLHRGADGFMSNKQFETFYWPGLKGLILGLIDAGLTPCPFFEGAYNQRLEYLTELPAGKIMGLFDQTDLFHAKEVIGKTLCLAGNMPIALLHVGTEAEIRDYTRKLIEGVGRDGGFIMSCGGVMDEADPERVKVWRDATREFGSYQ
jgi:hypothetical protein